MMEDILENDLGIDWKVKCGHFCYPKYLQTSQEYILYVCKITTPFFVKPRKLLICPVRAVFLIHMSYGHPV